MDGQGTGERGGGSKEQEKRREGETVVGMQNKKINESFVKKKELNFTE